MAHPVYFKVCHYFLLFSNSIQFCQFSYSPSLDFFIFIVLSAKIALVGFSFFHNWDPLNSNPATRNYSTYVIIAHQSFLFKVFDYIPKYPKNCGYHISAGNYIFAFSVDGEPLWTHCMDSLVRREISMAYPISSPVAILSRKILARDKIVKFSSQICHIQQYSKY